jgi:putative sigma-54 modulation protein
MRIDFTGRQTEVSPELHRFPIKPMTVDDAIDTLDATRTGLVVFRNTETERVNVIYRREDGNLGLVEPEP